MMKTPQFIPNFTNIKIIRLLTIIFPILFVSCIVSNNLYVNDPVPVSKRAAAGYVGVGMGLKPKIDSISYIGEVFSSGFQRSYNLVLGGRYGVTHLFNLGGAIHLPEIVGGFGASLRPQMSLLPNVTDFNIAIAADFGFVFTEDSVKILGSSSYWDNTTKGSINADFFLPIGQKLGKDVWLIVTPRYSFSTFYLRREFEVEKTKKMNVQYPALSLGLKMKKLQFETSVVHYNNKQKYMFGIVYLFGTKNITEIE